MRKALIAVLLLGSSMTFANVYSVCEVDTGGVAANVVCTNTKDSFKISNEGDNANGSVTLKNKADAIKRLMDKGYELKAGSAYNATLVKSQIGFISN